VDTIDADGAVARSSADAPEIDGTVRIARPGKLAAGDWADVTITDSSAYDLRAKLARVA
jgi:ribosomal protein S12 methylthiotransferase